MTWQSAAQRLGEELTTSGPDGYYKFTPEQWLAWAIGAVSHLAGRQPINTTPTDRHICHCRKHPCICLQHDAECESELTSHGYTPCRCAERSVRCR
jgi:hypothetical protein